MPIDDRHGPLQTPSRRKSGLGAGPARRDEAAQIPHPRVFYHGQSSKQYRDRDVEHHDATGFIHSHPVLRRQMRLL